MNLDLFRLVRLLTTLYPDQASSALLMALAGIQAERINAEMPALVRHFYIVREADKDGKVGALLDAALFDYPDNADLMELRATMTRAERLSRPRLTVLAIWPVLQGANPEGADEADSALYDAGIDYVALRGVAATRDNLVREWARVQPDLVEIMTHGFAGKIWLTDGPVGPGWIGRVAMDHPPRLILLLACEVTQVAALDIPDALLRAGVAAVIAADDRLLVTDAIKFARRFYTELSQDGDIQHAFDRARLTLTDEGAAMLRLRQRPDLEADRGARRIIGRAEPE